MPDNDSERNSASVQGRQVAECRLELALEVGSMAWWELDLATGKAVWSSGFEGLLGLAGGTLSDDLAGLIETLSPDGAAALREAARLAISSGVGILIDCRQRSDSRPQHFRIGGRAFRSESGTADRLVLLF